MTILFRPGMSTGARSAGVSPASRSIPEASALRFSEHLASPRGDANDTRRDRTRPPRAQAARLERLDGRPDMCIDSLTWRLTNGRFAGLVVHARMQQHTLLVTLIPANAGQYALTMRHRARIEKACSACSACPTSVTWCNAPHLA